MDFLQIRDDRPLSDWKRLCVEQLQRIMTAEDTYTLLPLPHYDTLTETVNAADRMRFEWLSRHPKGVWVDDDCFLQERWVPPRRGVVCLPVNESAGMSDGPDIFLVYANFDTDWIKRNMSDRARQKWIERHVKPEFQKSFYGVPLEMTRRWDGYEIIPKSVYIHWYETLNKELERRGFMNAPQNQQQPTRERHINDIVNEELVAFDDANARVKKFIVGIKGILNEQADRIAQLEKAISSFVASQEKKPAPVDPATTTTPEVPAAEQPAETDIPKNVIPLKQE